MFDYKAKITNIVDGDTLDFEIDLGFGITYNNRLRLYGIDTPEIRGKEREAGLIVKNYVENLLLNKEVYLETVKEKGKFGRYIAKVIFYNYSYPNEETDLSQHLIEKGMAKKVDY